MRTSALLALSLVVACNRVEPADDVDTDVATDTDPVATYPPAPTPEVTLDAACGVAAKQLCDPLDADGCDAGRTCDLAADGSWQCAPTDGVADGGTCDGLVGPFCGPGLTCAGTSTGAGLCVRLCCGDDACGDATCAPLHAVGDSAGAVGACVDPEADPYVPVVLGNHPTRLEGRGHVVTWASWRTALARELDWYAGTCPDVGGYPLLASATHYGGDCDPGDSQEVIVAMQDGTAILSYLAWDDLTGRTYGSWIELARGFADYIVDEALTPDEGLWPRVPRSTGIPLTFPQPPDCGIRSDGPYEIEPDKIGIAGVALLELSAVTGEARYADAALHWAEVLAANIQPGDDASSPWPFRVDWRDGAVPALPVAGSQAYNLRLFDLLIDDGHTELQPARDVLWAWIRDHQLPNAAGDGKLWVQFFEDHFLPGNRNAWAPLSMASYLMDRRERLDRHWREHVEVLLDFVEATFVDTWQGFDVCIEQDIDRKPFGGILSTYAAAAARYADLTGDPVRRAKAYQAAALLIQSIGADGCPNDRALEAGCGGWQEDAHTDKVHNLVKVMTLFPAWGE